MTDTLEGQPGGLGDFRDRGKPEEGLGLCLSGGGYRAMLFHVGALWRLNESGRVSSGLGGSRASPGAPSQPGCLRCTGRVFPVRRRWCRPGFRPEIVDPIRGLADHDNGRVGGVGGVFRPGKIGDRVVRAYAKHLYGDATLQDAAGRAALCDRRHERAVRGALALLTALYGETIESAKVKPDVRSPVAVTAVRLSPVSPHGLEGRPGGLHARQRSTTSSNSPTQTDVVLTDGGVYDNLGLETAWKATVPFSSATRAEDAAGAGAGTDWARHSARSGYHRQPGAAGSQRCRCGCPSTRPCNSLLCRESISCRLRRCPLDRQDDQGQTARRGRDGDGRPGDPRVRGYQNHISADRRHRLIRPLAGDRRRGACRRALGQSARSHEHGRRRLG